MSYFGWFFLHNRISISLLLFSFHLKLISFNCYPFPACFGHLRRVQTLTRLVKISKRFDYS